MLYNHMALIFAKIIYLFPGLNYRKKIPLFKIIMITIQNKLQIIRMTSYVKTLFENIINIYINVKICAKMFSFFQGLNKKSVKIILFKINIITLYNKLHILIYIYFKIF